MINFLNFIVSLAEWVFKASLKASILVALILIIQFLAKLEPQIMGVQSAYITHVHKHGILHCGICYAAEIPQSSCK